MTLHAKLVAIEGAWRVALHEALRVGDAATATLAAHSLDVVVELRASKHRCPICKDLTTDDVCTQCWIAGGGDQPFNTEDTE